MTEQDLAIVFLCGIILLGCGLAELVYATNYMLGLSGMSMGAILVGAGLNHGSDYKQTEEKK